LERKPLQEAMPLIIHKLKEPVKKAENEGIILAVETEESTNVESRSKLRKLFDRSPSDNLKVSLQQDNYS
jgi:hypothetical protein